MTLMYAGIDEAGYGPMLGPLCVASAALRVGGWEPGHKAPDLWAALRKGVCRSKRDAGARIAVGDSKDLKLANSSKTRHPLVHLERAVLAFLGARDGVFPTTDSDLFEALGVRLDDQPWYGGEPIGLPLGHEHDLLCVDASHLRTVLARGGIELVAIRVEVVGECLFNELYSSRRSKAAATEHALVTHMHTLRGHGGGDQYTRVVCDRQGGRSRYHAILEPIFNGIEVLEESPRASRYGRGEALGITLTPRADGAYFPVALASMAAKLVRELAMARFNRYWGARIPELKPTAGYVQDARRWLGDTREHITDEQRRAMVRLA